VAVTPDPGLVKLAVACVLALAATVWLVLAIRRADRKLQRDLPEHFGPSVMPRRRR
jgi:ammonia channel protein AmtB